jgi:hypothetical protein
MATIANVMNRHPDRSRGESEQRCEARHAAHVAAAATG